MRKIEIVIATNNQDKVKEFKEIFNEEEFIVTSLKEEGIISNPEETGTTFKENALIKAKDVARITNKIVISDDSGICIRALDNFPGIYSSRFMEGHPYSEKCDKIREMIKDKDDKSCAYYCVMALVNFDEEDHVFEGVCEGKVVEPIYTENGFGYDPMFFIVEKGKRFSEMSASEKHEISHRGKASRLLVDYIERHKQEYKDKKNV